MASSGAVKVASGIARNRETQVGDCDRPSRGRRARGQQEKSFFLTREVDQMKQRPLLRRRGILDQERSGRQRSGQFGFAEAAAGNDAGARRLGPDHRQMGFSGTGGSDQTDGIGRPVRPAVDQPKRRFVAGAGQKILARKTFAVIEHKR